MAVSINKLTWEIDPNKWFESVGSATEPPVPKYSTLEYSYGTEKSSETGTLSWNVAQYQGSSQEVLSFDADGTHATFKANAKTFTGEITLTIRYAQETITVTDDFVKAVQKVISMTSTSGN